MQALEKDRERRWASAEEMRLALQRAVPDAFTVGMDAEVAAFMSETCGQRALAKREVLRQIEQQSDLRLADARSLAKAGATAQSASSLRAVSVDTSASDERAEDEDADRALRRSLLPTLQPPLELPAAKLNRRRPWLAAALLGVGLVGASFVFQRSRALDHGAQLAGPGMVQLAPSSTARVRLAASASPLPEPAVAAAPSSALAPAPSAQASVAAAKSKPPKPRARQHAASAPSDLIAPEYAR
jgi:hypothetical protein